MFVENERARADGEALRNASPAREPHADAACAARRKRRLRALAWLIALLLAATASVVALSTRAGVFELEPYTPSEELEKTLALLPSIEHGKSLYRAHCAECHGAESWGTVRDGRTPALAGQHYQYLVKQIADLRRAAPRQDRGAFHLPTLQVLRSEQAIADVSAYLSGLTPNPRPRVGPGDHIQLGGDTYDWLCRDCHYDSGEGDAIFFTPRISAQHYEYLRQQLEDFAAGHRFNVPPELLGFAVALRSEERAALADYISRLAVAAPPERTAKPLEASTETRNP
ncbi:MAG TPA: c-type cytochrome [Steroidobacteraceae bacterium]|nr:c-type cytochrome [Steroidobacteraceae bacterium]